MALYNGYHYHVTETEIKYTGKVETWLSNSRKDAIKSALYTHKLHNRDATASASGVITCPSCGQIVIVKRAEQESLQEHE